MQKILIITLLTLIISSSCTKFNPNNYPLKKNEKIVKGVGFTKEKLLSSKSIGYKHAFKNGIRQISWSYWSKKNNIITLKLIPITIPITEIHRETKMINGGIKHIVYLKYKQVNQDTECEKYTGYYISEYSASIAYDKAIKNALSKYIKKNNVNEGMFKVETVIQFEPQSNSKKKNYICKLIILCKQK